MSSVYSPMAAPHVPARRFFSSSRRRPASSASSCDLARSSSSPSKAPSFLPSPLAKKISHYFGMCALVGVLHPSPSPTRPLGPTKKSYRRTQNQGRGELPRAVRVDALFFARRDIEHDRCVRESTLPQKEGNKSPLPSPRWRRYAATTSFRFATSSRRARRPQSAARRRAS